MKVNELINYLKSCKSDAIVKINAPFHDGYENSKVIDDCIEPELERVADRGEIVIIEIADYQVNSKRRDNNDIQE